MERFKSSTKERVLAIIPALVVGYIGFETVVKYSLFIRQKIDLNPQTSLEELFLYIFFGVFVVLIALYFLIISRARDGMLNYKLLLVILTGIIIMLKLMTDKFTVLLFSSLVS